MHPFGMTKPLNTINGISKSCLRIHSRCPELVYLEYLVKVCCLMSNASITDNTETRGKEQTSCPLPLGFQSFVVFINAGKPSLPNNLASSILGTGFLFFFLSAPWPASLSSSPSSPPSISSAYAPLSFPFPFPLYWLCVCVCVGRDAGTAGRALCALRASAWRRRASRSRAGASSWKSSGTSMSSNKASISAREGCCFDCVDVVAFPDLDGRDEAVGPASLSDSSEGRKRGALLLAGTVSISSAGMSQISSREAIAIGISGPGW